MSIRRVAKARFARDRRSAETGCDRIRSAAFKFTA
jgi:hypothetical protein